MPRPRFEKLSTEKRDRILETAAREFAAHGFEKASLNRILAQASISKGAAYYYFDDKADLFITVVQHCMADLMGETELVLEEMTAVSFWPQMRQLYSRQFAVVREKPWTMGVLKAVGRLPADMLDNPALAAMLAQINAIMAALIEQGQTAGVIRRDLPDALLTGLFTAVDDAFDRWFTTHLSDLDAEQIETFLDRLIDTMQRLLAPSS